MNNILNTNNAIFQQHAAPVQEPFNFLWWYPEKGFEQLDESCVDI